MVSSVNCFRRLVGWLLFANKMDRHLHACTLSTTFYFLIFYFYQWARFLAPITEKPAHRNTLFPPALLPAPRFSFHPTTRTPKPPNQSRSAREWPYLRTEWSRDSSCCSPCRGVARGRIRAAAFG